MTEKPHPRPLLLSAGRLAESSGLIDKLPVQGLHMASEPQARAIRPESPAEDDYQTLRTALEASARGRAFLNEHARRNRSVDIGILLTAINRLAVQMEADAEVVTEMRAALATVLDLLETRFAAPEESVAEDATEPAPEQLVSAPPPIAAIPPSAEPESPVLMLAVEPLAEEAPSQPVPLSVAIMPEVNVLDAAVAAAEAAPVKPASARAETPNGERMRLLAPIMALSEDERLALFT
jgi:hypothetical protein